MVVRCSKTSVSWDSRGENEDEELGAEDTLVDAVFVRGELNAEERLYEGVVADKFIADEDRGVVRKGDGREAVEAHQSAPPRLVMSRTTDRVRQYGARSMA